MPELSIVGIDSKLVLVVATLLGLVLWKLTSFGLIRIPTPFSFSEWAYSLLRKLPTKTSRRL